MIRLLIADDQELVRTGFRVILDAEPDLEVVGEAGDGREAIDAVHALHPDVVLMDIRMPNLDGIEATRRIATAERSPRVLILTTFDLDEYVYEALRAGASGFLLKDAGADELIHAVRVVAAGDALLAPSITRRLIEDYARRAGRPDATRRARRADRRASSRCCASSPAASRTPTSHANSSSATRPSRPTSPGSSPSSTCTTAHRQSSSPTNPASSSPAAKKTPWQARGWLSHFLALRLPAAPLLRSPQTPTGSFSCNVRLEA